MPPTPKALMFMADNLPNDFKYSVSVMEPASHWRVLATSILMGGHVRVGMEDNPYLDDGNLARSNADLVEKIVRISRELGREIASPDEARGIIELDSSATPTARQAV